MRYSGKSIWPSIWNFPVTPGAPVSGWPPPMLTGVVARGDDRITILGDHSQVAVLQLEMNLLARARFEMNTLEAAQSDAGRALDVRELEIDLHDLISRDLAGVGHRTSASTGCPAATACVGT